ncbi:hypothetical protein BKA61DRAFT_653312 [Leptodontidium sp. MPI-SDFR-AT-0119]|nr:hypothetical protein BKA61DRAFT_653312 [Leptodontidium sp. MPI-SDFR-AT-0119]
MPTEDTIKGVLDAPYQDFIASFLPLYSSPCVTVRIGSAGPEYNISKDILCKQSSYFAATFEGGFQEEQDQSTTLTEEEGVVSKRSFEILIQWLYLGRVLFNESTPTENITAAIEFVRLADMCGVTGMEIVMAEHIKAILLANPAPEGIQGRRDVNTNTYCLMGQHMTSAFLLPDGHPVRKVLAIAAVEGYIRLNHYKFLKEIRTSPNFAVDLLLEVKETLKTVTSGEPNITFIEPFSGKTLPFITESA